MRETFILAPGINGAELLRSLARYGRNTLGYRVCSPAELARTALMRNGVAVRDTFIPRKDEPSVVDSFLREIPYFENASYADAESVAAALYSMRSLVPENEASVIREKLPGGEFPEKNEALMAAYESYLAKLSSSGVIDTVGLIREALKKRPAAEGGDPAYLCLPDTDILTLKEYPLSPLERRLAEQLSGNTVKESTLTELFNADAAPLSDVTFTECYGASNEVRDIISYIFKIFGFEYEAQISLRDPKNPDKYVGSDANWEKAERAIIEACEEKGLKTRTELGEAAFYGPKLDFMVKDALGRRWQLGTIQVDYNLPERFQLEYTGEDNLKHRPVMIHRAPFGSMERFVAVLIEHTAGHFPLWLMPDQVAILPISEKYNDYAQHVQEVLEQNDVRTVLDDRAEKIGRKIRDNEMKHIPYLLIVGEKEEADGLVSVRRQGQGDQGNMKIEDFAKKINEEVRSMTEKY